MIRSFLTICWEKTWEKAERKMLQQAVSLALSKRDLQVDDAEVILAGDLLNQTVSANYASRTGPSFSGLVWSLFHHG